MNYCSYCGKDSIELEVPKDDHLPRKVCKSCYTIHYINPNMVVGSIPVFEDKVLLARRDIHPRKGYWNLPCGFLELNETVEDGAIREMKEETLAEIKIDYLHTVYNVLHNGQVYLIFKSSLVDLNFGKTQESSEVQLFSIDEIPWNEIAFSSNVFALKNYIKDLEFGFKNVHFGTYKHP